MFFILTLILSPRSLSSFLHPAHHGVFLRNLFYWILWCHDLMQSLTLQCPAPQGVWLRGVRHPVESDSAVSGTPGSLTPRGHAHSGAFWDQELSWVCTTPCSLWSLLGYLFSFWLRSRHDTAEPDSTVSCPRLSLLGFTFRLLPCHAQLYTLEISLIFEYLGKIETEC